MLTKTAARMGTCLPGPGRLRRTTPPAEKPSSPTMLASALARSGLPATRPSSRRRKPPPRKQHCAPMRLTTLRRCGWSMFFAGHQRAVRSPCTPGRHSPARRADPPGVRRGSGKVRRRCQAAGLGALWETGLMWAKALRAFQLGKARTSPEGPWSWMRPSRMASAHVSWPACHLTKASASAVM